MKNIALVSALSFLLMAGCGQSSKDDQQAEPEAVAEESASSGEPITLHARLDYVESSVIPALNANRKLNASIYMETDVMREGTGADAIYSLDTDESRVQGTVQAVGTFTLKSDEVSTNETYNMHNGWSALTKNPEGKFTINLPAASLVGEGLSVGVEIEVPVSGTKKAVSNVNGQTMDGEVTHSRPMFCSSKTADQDICTLSFTIDAVPTQANDSLHESLFENAKALYAHQGKKNAEGGLIMYSSMVPIYGATTKYNNGHFVTELNQQYTADLNGGDISQHIHLVVWSTKRGDKWQPEGLPPLKKPEVVQ